MSSCSKSFNKSRYQWTDNKIICVQDVGGALMLYGVAYFQLKENTN